MSMTNARSTSESERHSGAVVTPLRRMQHRMSAATTPPVSVLILTLNEELNLADCLESVSWCDDVVVLDSFSSDRTVEIALSRGARVHERAFDDYASQRNFGLQQVRYKHKWVLMLDADERVPEDLCAEMARTVTDPAPGVSLYLLRRRDHLFGKWIRRSSGYPTWFGRLARIGEVWVERPINEEYRTRGRCLELRGHLDHYPFNKGISAWIAKHDRYSTMEAQLIDQRRSEHRPYRDLFAPDARKRRRVLKQIAFALPCRPLLMFVALYFFKGGVFDGAAGFTFSALRAWYEYMIDCKRIELERRHRGLPV